jgi:hypothetical protein
VAAALAGSASSALLLRRWRALGHVETPPAMDARGLSGGPAGAPDAPLPWPLAVVLGAALLACAFELPPLALIPGGAQRLASHVSALVALFGFWVDQLDAQRRAPRARPLARDALLFLGPGLVAASRLALSPA